MKLSIIIPAYNAEPYLTELIDSLSPQLTEEVELLVIDDGSTIPVRERSEYKLIRQENGGASKARNTGLDHAKGEYIAFIDADDLVSDDYVDRIMEKIAEKPDYIYLSWRTLTGGWSCEVKLKSVEDKFPPFNLCCWNRVYKRSLIGKTRFNEKKKIAEDAEFIRAVKEKGKKAYIGECVYLYRSSTPNSLTKRFNAGEVDTERIVYYYRHITPSMKRLVKEAKEADKHAEVIFMTEKNDLPELEKYAMVMKPTRIKGTELRGEPTNLFTKLTLPHKTQVVIWTEVTQAIGGIETFIYNFCYYLRNYYDICVLYKTIDREQLRRLTKLVECVNINQCGAIECDTLIINRVTDTPPSKVKAKQTVQMVHTCQMGKYSVPKADKTVFVSEYAKKTFDAPGEVIHNMIYIPQGKKAVTLISATRLTGEKGVERYRKLVEYLRKNEIPYIWLFFTHEKTEIDGVIKMPPTLDIAPYIKAADYLVQLSDEESFCYTIAEAMRLGTKVITTPIGVLKELGFTKEHGLIVPFDMSVIPIKPQRMREAVDNTAIEKWRKVLGDTKPLKRYDPSEMVVVEVIKEFHDVECGVLRRIGEKYETRAKRAEHLERLNLVKGEK